MSKFIGDVSAYAYAVSKGYTGTEEEFAELMASYADVGQTAVDAKDAAVAAKTAAETAQGKAEDAQAAAEAVAESIPPDYSQLGNDVTEIKRDLSGVTTATSSDVDKALSPKTVVNGKVTEWQFKSASVDPSDIEQAVDDYLDEHPVVVSAAGIVSVADYGAVGDGVTDDSAAIQSAVDDNYDVYFESNKTYYLASTVTIDHDIKLHGGENTVIKTKTPAGGSAPSGLVINGTLKKTTTLTTDYNEIGDTDNSGCRFTLSDMTGIEIGDLMIVTATDQYYSYARQYYYLGAALLISDIYDGHLYTNISMPFDITNTANVSAEIYEAPTAIIENLNFISDLNSLGSYGYLVTFNKCKNSTIKNCNLSEMANGVQIFNCVNTLVDNITVAKSKYSEAVNGDGYGIFVGSSTNTIIRRVLAICAQGCVDLGGTIPCIDTFVYNCHLASESRTIGIDMHENSYNIVIEDCTLAGISAYGTVAINRCRFIKSNRNPAENPVIFRGSHDPKRAMFRITNCTFYGTGCAVMARPTSPQNPIQSFNNVFGKIEIENCENGWIAFNDSTSETIPANIIEELIIKNWTNCAYVYHREGNVIKKLNVKNTPFTSFYKFFDGVSASTDYIYNLDYQNSVPLEHKFTACKPTMGEQYVLPEGVKLQVSSDNPSAKFIVCGNNLVSDNVQDYCVGIVTGSVGSAINRTAYSGVQSSISMDSNGNLQYTHPNGTGKYAIFPIGMFYVKNPGVITMTATLKNVGNTDGATWYPYIAIVNAETGLITYRNNGASVTATAEGATITHTRGFGVPSLAMCYFYVATPVIGSITKFEDFKISCKDHFAPAVETDAQYIAHRLTGDGTILSLAGVNNIMCSENTFNLKFEADLVNNPIGL